MIRQSHSLRTERLILYGASLAVFLTLTVASTFAVLKLREGVTARIDSTTRNLATSVNQTIDGLIDIIDVSLLASADEIARQNETQHPDAAAITSYLEQQAKRISRVAYLRATDEAGNVVYGPGVPVPRVSMADRAFFEALRSEPTLGLYMAKPVVAKISGRPVLTFARRITHPDGRFAGTVYASIYLEEITGLLDQIHMETGGSIALRDRDLGLIARKVFGGENPIPMGNAKLAQPFLDALRQDAFVGSYVSDTTSLDPLQRYYAYRSSAKYPYMVNVGVPLDSAYAGWRRQVAVVFGLAALLALSVLMLARQISLSRRRLVGLVGILRESQTELVGKHAELVQSEERQRDLLQNLLTGLVVHGPDTHIVFSNACASRLLGLSAEQMSGKIAIDPAWHFVDAEGQPLALAEYPVNRVVASGASFDAMVMGVQIPGHDGPIWLEVSAFPEHEADGSLKQVVVSFYDITARRQAEQARARAARALRLVTDTNITLARSEVENQLLADICRLICVQGGYLMAWVGYAQNDAEHSVQAMAHWGMDEGYLDSVQISWNEASPYGQGPTGVAVRSNLTQVNRDYLHNPAMAPWRDAALAHGYQSSIALPFTKKSGVRGILTIYAHEEDAFTSAEVALLEELAGNLAYGLDSMEERRRRIEAESASQAKANFLANMSHEIRTPLNAITGMAHLIRKDGLTPAQSTKLDKLEAASQHLLRIINAILDLSKIDAGMLALEEAPLSLETLVGNVVSMIYEGARAKQIEVVSEVQPLAFGLAGDATRLQQALLNYAGNAVKFTKAGRVTLRALLVEESQDDALLRFEVTDTGIGIEAATLGRLFAAFEQADNSITRQYGGTGLGLAITKKLAQHMGGEAGVQSTPGVGSTFWFSARLRKSSATAVPLASSGAAYDLLRQRPAGTRVLVAEDEPVNREIATILLEDAGFAVDVAEDGQVALDMAARTDYALILMDMQMPRMGGLDATRSIRSLPGGAKVPIIAMTANAFAEDRARCLEAGMNDFITKPVPPQELYAAIVRALNGPES